MSYAHVISMEADMCVAHVKPRSGGRSQNYMPPEATDARAKGCKDTIRSERSIVCCRPYSRKQ